MEKVRVVTAALLTAGLLFVSGGKAQAVIGVPDDVPGSTLLYPFFKVDPTPTPTSRQDTLIVVTNTEENLSNLVHVTIWDVNSNHVLDFNVSLTEADVWSCSLLDLLVNPNQIVSPCGLATAPGVVNQLLRDGILQGYITMDTVFSPTADFPGVLNYASNLDDDNVLIGHLYLVDLPAGSASGFNAVSIESDDPSDGHPAEAEDFVFQTNFYLSACVDVNPANTAACVFYDDRERIDGIAGDIAQTGDGSTTGSPLGLQVRYFETNAINASTELWLWKDRNTTTEFIPVAVYDEDEFSFSANINIPDEVNFTEVGQIVSPDFPGGWFQITFDCGRFGCGGYDPTDPTTLSSPPIQAVAYSLQFANSQDATLRWDAAFPAHRVYTEYDSD